MAATPSIIHSRSSAAARDYSELVKLRVTTLVAGTAWCGAYLAGGSLARLLTPTFGIALAAAGSFAMNELIERNLDAKMRRTCMRPLVTGSISPPQALALGLGLVALGTGLLFFEANHFSAALTVLTAVLYLGVYTPLKTVGPLCTFVGAIPGAMPPLIGWVAIRGSIEPPAIALFIIMFVWQFPHFHSIALLYREDYERANIRMLAVTDRGGQAVRREILAYSLALVPCSAIPFFFGIVSLPYALCAIALGSLVFWCAWRVYSSDPTQEPEVRTRARQLLQATVLYLPLLLVALLLTRT